jgi:hypothetical protein
MKEEQTLEIIAPILKENAISPKLSSMLLESFSGFIQNISEYEEIAKQILVKEENQTEEMKRAREIRLKVKEIRVNANKKRIELKDDYLRVGKAIQGVYNIIEAITIPIERHLEKQEKFVELKREKEKIELGIKRSNLLSEFVEDASLYNLAEMSEQGFNELLNASKVAKEQKMKAEKELEEEQQRIIKEREAENERIRIENEKLKADAEKRKKELEKEKEEKAKIEAKLEEKRKADEKLKQEQAEKEAKELADKKSLELAPEKEKLNKLAEQIANIELPKLESEQANLIINQVKELLSKVSIYIIKNTKNL